MRQLVRQQVIPRCGLRGVFARGKHHMIPHCVRQGAHRTRRIRRLCIGMHPHPAEIVAEARFHEHTPGGIERLAGRAQHLMDDGRRQVGFVWPAALRCSRFWRHARHSPSTPGVPPHADFRWSSPLGITRFAAGATGVTFVWLCNGAFIATCLHRPLAPPVRRSGPAWHRARRQTSRHPGWERRRRWPGRRNALLREQARQLHFYRCRDPIAVARGKAIQYQFLDVQSNIHRITPNPRPRWPSAASPAWHIRSAPRAADAASAPARRPPRPERPR